MPELQPHKLPSIHADGQTFILLAGLPGSGKSTIARQMKEEREIFVVSPDMIRLALNAGIYPRDDQQGDYAKLEPIVWKLVEDAVGYLLGTGQNLALDATNLTKSGRAFWLDKAQRTAPGVHTAIFWCAGTWDSPERWLKERNHTENEYQAIRRRLEASVEIPCPSEANELWIGNLKIIK
jgi:predicted kinase